MKLQLQINTRAINDSSRSLEGAGIMITPPIDENFWLFRVPLSEDQAIVGFPKFNVIGIGFQKEEDWNTNLPSGTSAITIYEHIKCNKGPGIKRGACIEAIAMMEQAEAREKITKCETSDGILEVIGCYLRKNGAYKVAEAFGK